MTETPDDNADLARQQKHVRAAADRWACGVGPPVPKEALDALAEWQFEVCREYERRGETPPPMPPLFDIPDDPGELTP